MAKEESHKQSQDLFLKKPLRLLALGRENLFLGIARSVEKLATPGAVREAQLSPFDYQRSMLVLSKLGKRGRKGERLTRLRGLETGGVPGRTLGKLARGPLEGGRQEREDRFKECKRQKKGKGKTSNPRTQGGDGQGTGKGKTATRERQKKP